MPTPTAPAHVYFRPTTAAQRRLLFNTASTLASVTTAARRAHVGRGTYYYWRPRYLAAGEAGLETPRSRAPHHTRIAPLSADLQAEVLAYHAQNPNAGCRSIAHAIRQAHGWQKVIGHTKVHELIAATRAGTPALPVPTALPIPTPTQPVVVHAPQPNLTLNIDLCVVPLTHTERSDWVSLSLSDAAAQDMPTALPVPPLPIASWPGQTFANSDLSYAEQMHQYVEQRTAKRLARGQRKHQRRQKQAAQHERQNRIDELRLERRRQRLARRREDEAWIGARQAHRAAEQTWQTHSKPERAARRQVRRTQRAAWRRLKAQRQVQRQTRQAEDCTWRDARRDLDAQRRAALNVAPLLTAWLAILVVIDNGTRRCVGLPLFLEGTHVTAELIVAALEALCPPELQFLISDNGSQFTADAFVELLRRHALTHVRIAPHRPCTNGIAERFVRTLKEWLAEQAWHSPEEVAALLAQFIEYYNDRPHQGAELDGLSPNEFARRLTCSTS